MTSKPYMYDITTSIFLTSYQICMLSPYCFHDNTTTIPDISHTIFDITSTVSVSSLRWHTHLYWCIAVSVTSQQVCKSSHLAHVWHHTQSTSHHSHNLWHQWSCFMTSQTLHSRHQISAIWQHIHSLGHHTTLYMTSSPLYLTSRPLFLCHHTHSIDGITATIWMVSHPVYLWHHIHSIYDIISTKYDIATLCWWHHTRHMCDILCIADDITSTLSQQTTVFMMSHPPQAWYHTPCIRHCTHCIFVITTSPLISHPLLNDITPTFCVTSYALYITSHPIIMSSHFCTYDFTTSRYETTSGM